MINKLYNSKIEPIDYIEKIESQTYSIRGTAHFDVLQTVRLDPVGLNVKEVVIDDPAYEEID